MKKLLFIFAIFCMTSCAPKMQQVVSYFDYTTVSKEYNVQFTESNSVSFDYDALGSICVIETSGYVTKKVENNKWGDNVYGPAFENKREKSFASGQSVLELLANEAQKVGGDYVLNLKILPIEYNKTPAYQASGMIVRRK